MARLFVRLKRIALLAVIWGLALAALCRAASEYMEHRRLARSVAEMKSQYAAELSDYAALLHEGERLETDEKYQVELLKQRFGYTRPDETPIVVLQGQ